MSHNIGLQYSYYKIYKIIIAHYYQIYVHVNNSSNFDFEKIDYRTCLMWARGRDNTVSPKDFDFVFETRLYRFVTYLVYFFC